MMHTVIGYALILVVAAATAAVYLRKKEYTNVKSLKVAGIVLVCLFVVRYMWGRADVSQISGLTYGSALFNFSGATFLWLGIFCFLVTAFNCFYDFAFLKHLNKFVVFPLSVLSAAFYFVSAQGLSGVGAHVRFEPRLLFFAVETGLTLGLSAVFLVRDWKLKPTEKDVKNILAGMLPMLIACMPSYYLQVLFGETSVTKVLDFNFAHRIIIYGAIIVPILIYFAFKDRDRAVKKSAMTFVAFSMLITFSHFFTYERFLNPVRMPLHLCNTAMYIVPLCLLFNWRKLFYFTYFINVFGALAALLLPNYSSALGIASTEVYNFYVNHYSAFFMPLLMVALDVFPRPKWKEFKYSMAAFAIYFVGILIINAWFSNYEPVDFFFLNSEFVAGKFGTFGENLFRNFVWNFDVGKLNFTFYPVFQLVFFTVYVGFGFAMWFIYELGFQFAADQRELFTRKKAIRFDVMAFASRLNGRALTEPVNEEGKEMLKLINFSKKYGANKDFAVHEANLEVYAGEIFGFLGPNGAGKSTIIKSIVGIQPPTSGTVEVCGFDVVRQDVEAKLRLGFVPDHYALYERLTGREYINYIADIYKVGAEERAERVNALVEKFDLEGAFDNPIKTYSHGMKQKIAIIAALVHQPKVWVLDEPLTGLDPTSIHQVKETMKEYAKAGNIVFFSSHIIDVVERICDRIAMIVKGKIKTCVSLAELDAKKIKLEDLYLEIIGQKERA